MEVVLLLLGIIGVALVAVPRIQRRSGSVGRPSRVRHTRSRGASPAGRKRAAAAQVAPAVTTWTPAAGTAAPDDDGWDDDLGWEGVQSSSAPETREAWERWRATESPLAPSEPEPAASKPEVELPSVERWRAKAEEDEDWLEDDDGLGWEGAASTPALWNGNGHHPEPAPDADGRVPAPAPAHEPTSYTSGVDGRDSSPQEQPAPAALASASAATGVAPPPQTELGRTSGLEDDDWDEPVGRPWGAPDKGSRAASPSPAPGGRRKVHPVVMLALYAAVGIGLVVLASTLLLSGSTDSAPGNQPATRSTPATVVTPPEPTPEATGSAVDDPAALAAAEAAERKAQRQARRERTRALRARAAAVDRARAAERRKVRAAARKRAARRERATSGGAPSSRSGAVQPPPTNSPPPPTNTTPPSTNTTPPPPRSNPAPAPKRSNPVCEFCIG